MEEKKKTIKINFCDFYRGFNRENCKVTQLLRRHYTIEFSKTPDFLFYSCFGNEYQNYQNCVKIFLNNENILPNFNECDYGQGFDYLDFGERYFRFSECYLDKKTADRKCVDESYFNRHFCNFIYSNFNSGEGAKIRQEFCKKLMAYKRVDCPGAVLNNMKADDLAPRVDDDWGGNKKKFLKKYKFTIAFENSRSNGYTTEKLFDAFESFSVPIYWGNPLVAREFNPKAFINCNDFDNDFDAVIERIKELDNDEEKYLSMLRENPFQPDFDFKHVEKFHEWIINIIERGNKPFNKDPLDWSHLPYVYEIKALKETLNERKYKRKYLKYKILSKLTFGEQQKQYKEKKKEMKKRLKEIKAFRNGSRNLSDAEN